MWLNQHTLKFLGTETLAAEILVIEIEGTSYGSIEISSETLK